MPSRRHLAALAVLVALALYALLSHVLMTRAPDQPWTVAALFGPWLLALAAVGLKRRHAPTLLACAALAALLALAVARGGLGINRLYVLQHGAMHLLLAWSFGRTLRTGATPLISAIAERVHHVFSPEMRAYTRRLTALWTGYFLGMVVVSLLLYAFAPWSWWSLFCNVLTPLAASGLFVGEHVLRYLRHPGFERLTLGGALRAYRAYGACGAADAK
jgi:uncharacterized membrane protein